MVSPEALNEKRQQHFPALRHIRKAEPLRGKQKTMAGESGKMVHGKEADKTSGVKLSIKEKW